jgi:hypothetical protein
MKVEVANEEDVGSDCRPSVGSATRVALEQCQERQILTLVDSDRVRVRSL